MKSVRQLIFVVLVLAQETENTNHKMWLSFFITDVFDHLGFLGFRRSSQLETLYQPQQDEGCRPTIESKGKVS